jgi:hypothetical protein
MGSPSAANLGNNQYGGTISQMGQRTMPTQSTGSNDDTNSSNQPVQSSASAHSLNNLNYDDDSDIRTQEPEKNFEEDLETPAFLRQNR